MEIACHHFSLLLCEATQSVCFSLFFKVLSIFPPVNITGEWTRCTSFLSNSPTVRKESLRKVSVAKMFSLLPVFSLPLHHCIFIYVKQKTNCSTLTKQTAHCVTFWGITTVQSIKNKRLHCMSYMFSTKHFQFKVTGTLLINKHFYNCASLAILSNFQLQSLGRCNDSH